jgi:hypothetical protein
MLLCLGYFGFLVAETSHSVQQQQKQLSGLVSVVETGFNEGI